MKQKLKRIGVILAVLLLGIVGAFLLWPRDRITPASWEKIHIGMTEKDVEALLERPGINSKWEEFFPINFFTPTGKVEFQNWVSNQDLKIWEGHRGIIGIQFDAEGKVSGKLRIMPTEQNIWDRLRDWLGW